MKIWPLLLCLPFCTNAEVLNQDAYGFSLKLTRTVTATPAQAYQQFLNIGQWWNPEHTWFGNAAGLYLEPKAGGCFCEVNGENSALHMTVSYVEPNKELRMIGGLGPLQLMGVHGGMSWQFEALDNKKSKITLSYNVVGTMENGLDKLAAIVDGVQAQQLTRLADKLNSASK